MAQKPRLIGFTGAAGSGKDTAADFYVAFNGGYRYAFADPMRRMLAQIGIDLNHPHWVAKKEEVIPLFGVSPRRMMQTLGTEWGRNCVDENFWVILANLELLDKGPGMVVSDVRFENEVAWVRRMGGLVVHVLRAEVPAVEGHVSESGVKVEDGDFVLVNNGSLEDLHDAVRKLLDGSET